MFHDRSLQDMAARKPQTLEALAACHGVGARKLERYGDRFLAEIVAAGDAGKRDCAPVSPRPNRC